MPRATLAINAALGALLLWLYLGDLSDAARAKSSEVSALSELPSVPFAVVALAGALAGLTLTAVGALGRRDKTWRGYRVMPIVAVVVLFVDLFILTASKSPFSSRSRAVAAVDLFEQRATQLGTAQAVASDARTLEPVLQALGPVPWLIKGQSVPDWRLRVFEGCGGPKLDAAGERAGTLLYCVAPDRAQAWITVVGLPFEQRFGPPQVVTQAGTPLLGTVHPLPPAENEASPSFTGEPDAGTLSPP